ncbi:MAG: carbohydrate-binding family 9-like protein [Candidatus Cryptobacteroides sp.]
MKIHRIPQIARAEDIPAALSNAEYHKVAVCNWPEAYPYAPRVEFAAAHSGGRLYLHYRVEEQTSRAAAAGDMGRVWEDSCVEFFCAPQSDSDKYYNIECNCIGKVLLCCGEGRHDRRPVPAQVLSEIQRWSSLGDKPFEEKPCGKWEVALSIPVKAFFESGLESFDGLKARANFYKCGDLLSTPHFLSLAPIATAQPDFHRPEYFTDIEFE